MKVKITNLARNPMQSGLGKKDLWVLTYKEDEQVRNINNLTGWTSCNDIKTQLRLKFNSKEDAIEYAKSQNFEYVIVEAKSSKEKAKSYVSNFTKPVLN